MANQPAKKKTPAKPVAQVPKKVQKAPKAPSKAALIRQQAANFEKRIHILPSDGKWIIRKEGATKASKIVGTKAEALKAAKAYVKSGSANTIISHKKDGTFSKVR